jgi:hypothetical protein
VDLSSVGQPKGEAVTGEWRQLRNGELQNLWSSQDVLRRMKWEDIIKIDLEEAQDRDQ